MNRDMTNKQVTFKGSKFDVTISGDSAKSIAKEYMDFVNDLERAFGSTPAVAATPKTSSGIRLAPPHSLSTQISKFVTEGFFDKNTTITQVKEALAKRGIIKPSTSLSDPLQQAVKKGVLKRDLQTIANKKVWVYQKSK